MIGKILTGIMSLVISLVNVLLSPIDTLITNNLPSLDSAFTAINNLIDYIISVIGYAVDMSGLSSTAISLIITYYTFILLSRPVIYIIKLAIKWYSAIKP